MAEERDEQQGAPDTPVTPMQPPAPPQGPAAPPADGEIPPAPSTAAPSAPATAAPGTTETPEPAGDVDPERERIAAALPNYDIGRQIGKGGWGVVYEGKHKQLGREVAIKQLPANFSTDPEVRARFLAEARTLAALDHPHVVPVYDFVESDGLCLLVMEKLSGGTVWSRFASAGMSMEAACAAVLATCAGLQNAHAHQILHRDIKPENLIFNAEGTLKVTDFGIAKMLSGQRTMATRAGEVIGTPAYMAPEQAKGQDVTPATDVYAVGVMLYELLSGRRPFVEEGDPLALLFKHAYEEPDALDEVAPDVPAPLVRVTMKSLAKDPAERYQSAEEMGVAVAEAATESWGPGWLLRASLPVMAAGSMVAATERISAEFDASQISSAPSVTVKPNADLQARGKTGPRSVDAADLVPVEDVVPNPPSSLPAWAAMLLLLAAVAVVAFGLDIGEHERGGTLPPGTVSLAGQDPATEDAIELDLSEKLPITGPALPAPGITQLELRFTAAGVPLGNGTSTVATNPDGSFAGEVDPAASRFMLTGPATGELAFLGADGTEIVAEEFEVDTSQASYLTGPFVAASIALFFLLGYVESMVRALRRGRRRIGSVIGLTLFGIPIGVAVSVVAWAATQREPTREGIAATSAVAAAAGLAAAWGSYRSGRRRRHARAEAAKARAAEAAAA